MIVFAKLAAAKLATVSKKLCWRPNQVQDNKPNENFLFNKVSRGYGCVTVTGRSGERPGRCLLMFYESHRKPMRRNTRAGDERRWCAPRGAVLDPVRSVARHHVLVINFVYMFFSRRETLETFSLRFPWEALLLFVCA